MTSAAEAEIGAMYINAREAVHQRMTLSEMGHPQPRTPMQTDNSEARAVVTKHLQPRRTKAMDMRFHWLQCRDTQGQFRYYWKPDSSFPSRLHTRRAFPKIRRTARQLSSDWSNIRPRLLKVSTPLMHYAPSSPMRLKDASAHWLVIVMSLLGHHI